MLPNPVTCPIKLRALAHTLSPRGHCMPTCLHPYMLTLATTIPGGAGPGGTWLALPYSDLQNCLNVLQFCVSMPISQSDLHQITWLKMCWKAVLLEFPTHVQSRNLDKIWWICQLFFDLNALRQFCNCYLIPHPHRLPLWNLASGGGNKLCNYYNRQMMIIMSLQKPHGKPSYYRNLILSFCKHYSFNA